MSSVPAVPTSSITNIADVHDSEDKLLRASDALRDKRFPVTVAFFDLVGSTSYRVDSGLEAGLAKAARHNFTVSHAIQIYGGHVVKWMGDGVLGCFYDTDDQPVNSHTARALRAGLAAIEALKKYNEDARKRSPAYSAWRNDVITRVGISSGPAHFIVNAPGLAIKDRAIASTAGTDPTRQYYATDLDPMGSCVDLAARLESLAGDFVILVDRDTFWGYASQSVTGTVDRPVRGICEIPELQIPWRRLILEGIRTTVYMPYSAPLFVSTDKLLPSKSVYSSEAITPVDLEQLANDELNMKHRDNPDLKVVYVSRPIPRNIRGFDQAVDVIAISGEPNEAPAKHAVHISRSNQRIKDSLETGEKLFRSGKQDEVNNAIKHFLRVVEQPSAASEGERSEPRHFRANFRLAQLYRKRGDIDMAMEFLLRAKASDDRRAIAWKFAGVIHLENSLRNTIVAPNEAPPITRAIAAFSRAKQLAYEALDGEIEQCCTALLALCYYLRRQSGDPGLASSLLGDLENWAVLSSTIQLLQPILQAFAEMTSGGRDRFKVATNHLSSAKDRLNSLAQSTSNRTIVHDEALLGTKDIQLIIARAQHDLDVCEIVEGVESSS